MIHAELAVLDITAQDDALFFAAIPTGSLPVSAEDKIRPHCC